MNDIFFPQKNGKLQFLWGWLSTIHRMNLYPMISIRETNWTIHRMAIYPVDEACSVVTRRHLGNAIGGNRTYKPETAWLKFAKFAVNRDFHESVFSLTRPASTQIH